MTKKELKWIGNGLVFYGFGFVLSGMDELAVLASLALIAVSYHVFGLEKMFEHWEYILATGLAELVLIQRTGMAVSCSSLFIVSFANLIHAFTWAVNDYHKTDGLFYQAVLAGAVVITFLMPSLPLGFVGTMVVIFLVFTPYAFLAGERRRFHRTVSVGKKHMTVIE
ncbi:MAG: hypothetical protein ACI32N_09350 [Bulleidia sp.]